MKKWSTARLLAELRRTLLSDDLVLSLGGLRPNISATIAWPSNEPVVLKVDPAQAGIITCVIHELLHLVLIKDLEPFDDTELEEPIIEAIEATLYSSLTSRQHGWWRKAIKSKLEAKHGGSDS